MILFGLLPLIAFVAIDAWSGLRAGIIAAVVIAFLELIYTVTVYKTLDQITLITVFTLALFSFFAYRSNSALIFKIQPVVMGGVFALIFIVMQIMGTPVLSTMAIKYAPMMPPEVREQMANPNFLYLLERTSLLLGGGFLLHAGAVAYAAYKMSNWWWLIIRGLGIYVMMFLCSFLAAYL